MPRKPLTAQVPPSVAAEIGAIVERTQRSPAFIALRAVSAAPDAPPPPPGDRAPLPLPTDEDDPPNTIAKLEAAAKAKGVPTGELIAGAWLATRERFERWAAKEEALREAERADDLDAGLREATAPATPAGRLAALAASPYPRIRALVAGHAHAPKEALAKLAEDREPYVREAVARRGA